MSLLLALLAAVSGCCVNRTVPNDPPQCFALSMADGSGKPWSATQSGPSLPPRHPRQILALSSGGAYGAYAVGFLAGWSASGTRPEFDVVTGVSTGALIAPMAFLGPEYDSQLSTLYTGIQAQDVFRIRAWVTIPFKDSVASSAPLRDLIQSQITPELLTRIAAEHRKGRRLYVGTTNLDSRRLVVWDMGAIACRASTEGCALFRDVLLASSAVPGMMSPVPFELQVDGKQATELHCDGGVTAPVFVPSDIFARAAQPIAEQSGQPKPGGNLYVVIAGKLYPDAGPIRRRVLPVLGASTESLLYAHCRAECANLYGQSRGAGLKYHLTYLQQDFHTLESSVNFDKVEMGRLLTEGKRQGQLGPAWHEVPPAVSPGDGDFVRTGLHMRTTVAENLKP